MNANAANPVVLIAYKSLPQYRVRFFAALRERLAADGIDLVLVHGQPAKREAARRDTAELDWALRRRNRVLSLGRRDLIWQPCIRLALQADLVIVEQASRLLVNYPLLALQALGAARVAFWGHGANLQHHRAHRAGELVKRFVSRHPHWWFAYTARARARVEELGYPGQRITVVQNAIDTRALEAACESVGAGEIEAFRRRHGLGAGPVGIFVGGLYADKRLPFLLEASDLIAGQLPDFRLLVIGDGPERAEFAARAAGREHVRILGPLFDREKAVALATARVMLMPGLVGLAVLDAFAARVPMITTAVEFHSPEIDYLVDGRNGIVAPDPEDAGAYADRVVSVLTDAALEARLAQGCAEAAALYTNEAMVSRFAEGVRAALDVEGVR
jgi:glycosyltransferase involved in cell wall biosynthesis